MKLNLKTVLPEKISFSDSKNFERIAGKQGIRSVSVYKIHVHPQSPQFDEQVSQKTKSLIYQTLDSNPEGNTSYLSPIQGIGLIESVRNFLKAISDFIKTRTFGQQVYKSLYTTLVNKRNHLSEVFMNRKLIGFKTLSDCGGHRRINLKSDNHLVFEGSNGRKYL